MATISELSQICGNVYQGTESATQNILTGSPLLAGLNNSWIIVTTSAAEDPGYWKGGYFGVAYYNTVTHDFVIANRGTDLGNGVVTAYHNLMSDAALGLLHETQAQIDATNFAQDALKALAKHGYSYSSVIETGHSLGGNEAQAGLAYLVDNDILPNSVVSGVVFNSPGIGGYAPINAPSSYNVVDFYDQGDAIHTAGGTHLGAADGAIMLAAGPNTSELALAAPLAVAAGPGAILALLGAALYDVTGPAHSIGTIISDITDCLINNAMLSAKRGVVRIGSRSHAEWLGRRARGASS